MKDSKVYFSHYDRTADQAYTGSKLCGGPLGKPYKPQMATVAVQRRDETIYVAFSNCGPSDQFCRKTGRVKSKGRLLSKTALKFGVKENFDALAEADFYFFPLPIIRLMKLARDN